jgi:hypothetical protein
MIVCLFCLVLLSSCASNFKVLDNKTTDKPLSRMMIIYVDCPIQFLFFDSVTYNFGIKSSFADTEDAPLRLRAESRFSEKFTPFSVDIIKSADLFDVHRNSYEDFNKQMDSLNIDAVLVVNLHRYDNDRISISGQHLEPGSLKYGPDLGIPNTMYWVRDPDREIETTGSIFTCYLIRRDQHLPVWKARFELNGAEKKKRSFTNKVAGQISIVAKKLAEAGYITHESFTN